MKSLVAKFGLLLAAAFAVVACALLMGVHTLFDRTRLIELSAGVMIASAAFSLLAALCVFQLFTRRLNRLAQAVATLAHGGFTQALQVPGADARGDEIDRLSAHVEQMSARIAGQWAELERSARRRRELLVNVSHDLRTPLASMQGYLELMLLRHGSLPEAEQRNYLETATRHSERLTRLVNDLFELSSLEAETALPQAEDFVAAELAHDVVQKFAHVARQRGVELRAEGSAADMALRVRADLGMIERVLAILIDNALRHTPAAGHITVEFSRQLQHARLAVRDTGSGIAADQLPGLFERYAVMNRSAPAGLGGPGDRAGGSGLGLAIAQRIVLLHGGALQVDSRLGQGSCFSFDLPVAGMSLAPAQGIGAAAMKAAVLGVVSDSARIAHRLAVLDAVSKGTATALGEAFFPALVRHFASALNVDCAFITECVDQPTTRVRTLAWWSAEGFRKNFEFDLSGTPCEAVVQGRQACFHRSGLSQLFPREAGYEGYYGLPMIASDGRLLGHLAFMHRQALDDDVLLDSVYRIFLARAAAELERARVQVSSG